jgi:hypothetical protein
VQADLDQRGTRGGNGGAERGFDAVDVIEAGAAEQVGEEVGAVEVQSRPPRYSSPWGED